MESKIMCVFYGNDCLPYKDSARTVHYPIIGNAFNGANNTTQIRFYVDRIGGTVNAQWVAVTKLPNGQIGTKVLENSALDSELGEYYVTLDLSTFYTSLKGDIYISLNGYQGGVNYEEDDGIYSIYGTPTIQATGSIKLAINYAPQMFPTTHFATDDLQQILGLFSQYLKIENGIVVIGNITTADLSGYDDGQLFYCLTNKQYYEKTNTSPYYALAEDTGLLGSKDALVRLDGDALTISEIYDIVGNKMCLLSSEIQEKDYLCIMSYEGGSLYDLTLFDLYNLLFYDAPNQDANDTLADALSSGEQIKYASKSYVDTNFVKYNGATSNVDLGEHYIVANEFYVYGISGGLLQGIQQDSISLMNEDGGIELNATAGGIELNADNGDIVLNADGVIQANTELDMGNNRILASEIHFGSSYYQMGLIGSDLVIGTGIGSIYLQPSSKLYYGAYEIATQNYVDNAIASAISSVYRYKGSKTVAELNALTGQVIGDVYNVSDSGILNAGSVSVVAGDNVVWGGSAWDKLASDIDLSDYYTKSQTDTLLNAKANTSNAVMDDDLSITSGYIRQIKQSNTWYPIAENVSVTTTPKVVATTSDLPADNDGYLYLVVADGYLYYWDTTTNDWAQGYEYAQDLSNFVQTSRTIAGIDLSANISAQALTDALVLATNTEIDNLF